MSGVANLNAGITTIARLRKAIADLPLRIRQAVATDAADALNAEVRADFARGVTVYDEPRPAGVKGQKLSLVKTGTTKRETGFDAKGTIVRAELATRYAKYLVGKYRILPQKIPPAWQRMLEKIVREYREDWEREALR